MAVPFSFLFWFVYPGAIRERRIVALCNDFPTKDKPPTSSLITGPTRLAAMFLATHWYSPESPIWTRLMIKFFFEVKRMRRLPSCPSKSDGLPILYHVMFGRGEPYGGLHFKTTVVLGGTTWYNWTVPKLRRRKALSMTIISDCRTTVFPHTLHLHVILFAFLGKSAAVTILVLVLVLQVRQDFPHTLMRPSLNFLPLHLIWIRQTFTATQVRLAGWFRVT